MINDKLYLLVAILILIIINVALFSKKMVEYLDDNWREVRCYPHIIPFAGLSNRPKGNNFFSKTVSNFNDCTYQYLSVFLKMFMVPLVGESNSSGNGSGIINGISKGVLYIKNTIDKFRRIISVLREMFFALVENTANRLKNTFGSIIYLQEKLKVLIKKQSAMFEVLNQFATTLPFLLYSFSHGPIPRFAYWLSKYLGMLIAIIIVCLLCMFGGPFTKLFTCPICLVCFTPDTMVDIDENNKKAIKYISVGDKIKDNTVLGKIYIKNRDYELYEYKGIMVTGNHLVFEDNIWKRIYQSQNAKKINKNTSLYCLITTNNTIYIDGIKFRDYQETKDIDINLAVSYKIARYLNNNKGCISSPDDKYNNYYWGFSKNTIIKLGDDYIKMEDLLKNPDEYDIDGIIKIDSPVTYYNYDGIEVSGNTLVYENGIWLRVFQSHLSKKIHTQNEVYNIITRSNNVIVKSNNGDILFKDFIEESDNKLNSEIDNLIQDRLNLMYTFDL